MATNGNPLTDHLDLWTSALLNKSSAGRGGKGKPEAYGIRKLRELILELAVRGKLVPQDPNDEPASVLLDSARTALERLIKERQIRQVDEAELSQPSITFGLPKGWAWVHVKDIAIVQGGKRLPSGAALLETPTPHIYIRVTDMKNGTISKTGLMYISPEVHRHISRYTINKDDLYITIAGTIGDVGIVPDYLDGQNLTENAAKIVFRILDKRFLHLVLSSKFVQAQFLEKTKQMAQPKLALKRISGAKVCLPPLAEQHRIVAKVDELMALCDRLEQQQTDSQEAHQTLVETLLGTLTQIPARAEPVEARPSTGSGRTEFEEAWSRIADHFDTLFTTEHSIDQLKQTILQLAVMGKLVPKDSNDEPAAELLKRTIAEKKRLIKEGEIREAKPPVFPVESPDHQIPANWIWTNLFEIGEISPRNEADDTLEASFVPMQALSEKYGVPVEHEVRPWGEIKSGFTHFREGDVALAKITPCFQNGKSAVMRGLTNEVGAGTTELHVYRSINRCTVPEYVLIYLKSPKFIGDGIPKMTGTAGQKRITRDYFAGNHFPLPPLAEQHRIVAKVDELMALCDALKARLKAAQATQINLADAIVELAAA